MANENGEWFSKVSGSVVIPDGETWGGSHIVDDDEIIFSLSIQDFLLTLENESEFYKNPTKANLNKFASKFLDEMVQTFRQDAGAYVSKAIPLFLESVLDEDQPEG